MTDANVAAGRAVERHLLAGTLRLDAAAARRRAIEHRAQAARPGCAADRRRDRAHRQHPDGGRPAPRVAGAGAGSRSFALVAFGGAGPLHAATLARSVGISDRARAALSRASTAPSACCRRACAIPTCGRRSASLSASRPTAINELFASSRGAGHAGGGRGGICARARSSSRACSICAIRTRAIHCCVPCPAPFDEADTDDGSSMPSTSLHQQGLWPERAERECGDRHLPPAGGDRGAAPRVARACRTATAAPSARIKGQRPLYDIGAAEIRTASTSGTAPSCSAGDRHRRARRSSTSSIPPPSCSPARRSPSKPPER